MKHFTLVTGLLLLTICCFSQKRLHKDAGAKDSSLMLNTQGVKLVNDSRWYLTLHTGYAVALGTTFKFYPDDVTNISVNMPAGGTPSKQVTSKATTRGLGEGFRYGAGISYILNDFINVGIDFDYFSSTIRKTRDSAFQSTEDMAGGGQSSHKFNQNYTISYQTRLLTIAPNITFKAISRPKFFIYNKVGAILSFRPNSIQKESQNNKWSEGWTGYFKDSASATNTRYEWGIKNPAFGFMGAVGGQVRLTERIRAYAEVQFTHILFVVRNRILTNMNVDGQEMAKSLSLSQREVDFKETVTSDEWAGNPDKPTVAVTQRFPLTYVGLQVGLAYRF